MRVINFITTVVKFVSALAFSGIVGGVCISVGLGFSPISWFVF